MRPSAQAFISSCNHGRALCVEGLQLRGVDEELLAQVLVDFAFAFGFGEAAQGIEIVGLDAVEVVLGLGVDHAEDGVGVGLAGDVGDAPVVADDGDVGGFALRGARLPKRRLPAEDQRESGLLAAQVWSAERFLRDRSSSSNRTMDSGTFRALVLLSPVPMKSPRDHCRVAELRQSQRSGSNSRVCSEHAVP